MSTFFWADTHFNHAGIIGYSARPYSNVAEMNTALVERWNARVGPRDTVWLLGDFAFKGEADLDELFSKLRGVKCLVVGNHDERNPAVLKLPWERIERLYTYHHDKYKRAELCHYPLETWKSSAQGALALHGHSHGTLKRQLPHRFDVGADVFQSPVTFEELWERAIKQRFEPVDHHGNGRTALPPGTLERLTADALADQRIPPQLRGE